MATLRQKKAFTKVVENGGKVSTAMREAGYTPATAQTPQKLTQSKGWNELMEKYLPDKLLAEKHKQLLMVPKKVRHFKKGELETEYEELDSQAIAKGLDMGYKLKGKYAPEKTLNLNVDVAIDPKDLDLATKINELETNNARGHKQSEGASASSVGGEVQN